VLVPLFFSNHQESCPSLYKEGIKDRNTEPSPKIKGKKGKGKRKINPTNMVKRECSVLVPKP
jgi:hypothetical protein